MKKYFYKPFIVVAVVLLVVLSTTVAFACTTPGSGSMAISSNRLTATATTTGKIHSGDGAYNNRLTARPSIVTYLATDPAMATTTVTMQSKDSSNVKSVSSTKTVSTSTVIKSGKNVWSATCYTSGNTKNGTATAR